MSCGIIRYINSAELINIPDQSYTVNNAVKASLAREFRSSVSDSTYQGLTDDSDMLEIYAIRGLGSLVMPNVISVHNGVCRKSHHVKLIIVTRITLNKVQC